MPRKEIQEHLCFFGCPCHCVKGNNCFSYITLGKAYCQSSRRLSVSETSLSCGLVVHINLVIACFVQASDDRLLKMGIDHHNQQILRLINRLFPIIGTSLHFSEAKDKTFPTRQSMFVTRATPTLQNTPECLVCDLDLWPLTLKSIVVLLLS